MSLKELLERLETIHDGLSDIDGMERYGVEGTMDDISNLMNEVKEDGISGDPDYPGCCVITLNKTKE